MITPKNRKTYLKAKRTIDMVIIWPFGSFAFVIWVKTLEISLLVIGVIITNKKLTKLDQIQG